MICYEAHINRLRNEIKQRCQQLLDSLYGRSVGADRIELDSLKITLAKNDLITILKELPK